MGILMTEKRKNIVWAVLCAAVYIVLLWNLVPFVYGIIDDRSMMEIVSGQYLGHPDAHTIFSGYWYSLFLAGLYGLIPNMDWYAFLYLVLQGFCMSLVIYRLICRAGTVWKRIAVTVAVYAFFLAFTAQALVQLTFTTTAAVLGVTVIFWYMTTEKIRRADIALLFVLCFLTQQVRYDIFYMILPVCGILWVFRFFEKEQKNRWHLLIPVCVLGVLGLGALGNMTGYGSQEWRAYKQYDQNRTAVYDFPTHTLPIYEGAEDFYASIGIEKKSRARTLINYNYTADDRITPDFFGEYIEAYDRTFPSDTSVRYRILQSAKEYVKGVLNGRFHVQHMAALILYGLLAVWYFAKKNWRFCGKIICATGIQVFLWMYLLYTGRIPERVIYSMNLMLLVTVILLWTEVLQRMRISGRILRTGTAVCCVFLFAVAFFRVRELRQENLEMSHRNGDIEALKEYCMEHSENFYFNDVTSMAFTTYNVQLWRAKPYTMNYMSLGDWMSFSPIWQEKLEQQGIVSVKEALYEWDSVFLICNFDKGLEYLTLLYEDVTCTEVDKISGFTIYRMEFL